MDNQSTTTNLRPSLNDSWIPTSQNSGTRNQLRVAVAYWPGVHHGVRGPTPDETPLSWEEVQHGMAAHIIGGM
jgi:hypothetical protein